MPNNVSDFHSFDCLGFQKLKVLITKQQKYQHNTFHDIYVSRYNLVNQICQASLNLGFYLLGIRVSSAEYSCVGLKFL